MFQITPKFPTNPSRTGKSCTNVFGLIALMLVCAAVPANAQSTFNSGSTGADGAFAPTANQTLQIPESGTFNFTTINIPSGVTIKFTPNPKNTPVTMLASGNITIAGIIILDGAPANTNNTGGVGGPGGFRGGTGGSANASYAGTTGDGRGGGEAGNSDNGANSGGGGGGGHASAGSNASGSAPNRIGTGGPRYGSNTLLPLVGGSGGGGGGADVHASYGSNNGGSAGGGGGAILLASSNTITFSGSISAKGGNGPGIYHGSSGGGGAGGAIRLVANAISGTGSLDVRGGAGGYPNYGGSSGGSGGYGYIRVEAYDNSAFSPIPNSVAVSITQPNPVAPPNNPRLSIATVAGVATPALPSGSLHAAPDILLPSSGSSTVDVVIEASNISVGTIVQVTLTPASGARTTVQASPLTGTLAASSATTTLTLPSGMSVISATATIDMTTASAKPMFFNGERINHIEVAASYGGTSQVTYVTSSGKRLTFSK